MTLHIYRPDNIRRIRRICPYHKKHEYATIYEYYDSSYINFDCGTTVDTGEGVYEPPKKYKRLIIFWDDERDAFRLFARYVWKELFAHKDYKKVLRVAKDRIKAGGVIKEPLKLNN